MNRAKELADDIRNHGYSGNPTHAQEVATLLSRLAAIDSAVPVDAQTIEREAARLGAQGYCNDDVNTLLAIVQRQAGEMEALTKYAAVVEVGRDMARAEVERLKGELATEREYVRCLRVGGEELTRDKNRLQQEKTEAGAAIIRLRAEANEQRSLAELAIKASEKRTQETMVAEERARVLENGIRAYRTGGYTASQVWENEEGHAVPR